MLRRLVIGQLLASTKKAMTVRATHAMTSRLADVMTAVAFSAT